MPNFTTTWTYPLVIDGTPTRYGWVVRHPDCMSLGRFTDIGYGTYIQAEAGIIIGKHCQIGAHCAIYTVSTIDGKSGPIYLAPYSCIGAGSVVMPGVQVGEGAIIGALSFVNRSIPARQVWGGNPIHYLKDVEDPHHESE